MVAVREALLGKKVVLQGKMAATKCIGDRQRDSHFALLKKLGRPSASGASQLLG